MNKYQKGFAPILVALIVLFLIGAIAIGYSYKLKTESKKLEETTLNYKNCTYIIEGINVTLKNGYSEEKITPSSASKIITQYFGNEVSNDLNGDGLSDVAFILTQNTGGSGTFYYIAVALGNNNGCKGTNAILLGDRIAPQNIEIQDGKIIVNYADRKIDEAMTIQPSIGITKQFTIEGTTLKDVTTEEVKKEQSCLISGGKIETLMCCTSVSDFPNLCLIGACGCSSTNSHQIKTCNCGENKCFNGKECVAVMP